MRTPFVQKEGSSGTRYWRQLTDEELLEIRFTTDDPERVPNLIQDVPAPMARSLGWKWRTTSVGRSGT